MYNIKSLKYVELEENKPKKEISKETRKRMSIAKYKNPTRYWLGKKREFSQEHRDNIKRAMTGKKFTQEHIKNMIASRIRNQQNKIK